MLLAGPLIGPQLRGELVARFDQVGDVTHDVASVGLQLAAVELANGCGNLTVVLVKGSDSICGVVGPPATTAEEAAVILPVQTSVVLVSEAAAAGVLHRVSHSARRGWSVVHHNPKV